MSRRTTMKHAAVAVVATGAVLASSAAARPLDRIDRYAYPTPVATPALHQDLRGEHATDPAPPGSEKFMPGQPTWPAHPTPVVKPAVKAPIQAPATDGGGGDDVWLIVGIGLAAGGIVAGSAAGAARRHRVRARRVAV